MKKVVIFGLIMLVFLFVLYQNGSLWILRLLSFFSGSSSSSSSRVGAAGPTPPYKDGTYTGNGANAFYGNIQVQAVIQNGKISHIQFLQYPNDRARSIAINSLAMPNLIQEAITAQSANVDIVSGATDSSNAFATSLASALQQAK